MLLFWRSFLLVVFIWAAYHLIRDTLQDVFDVHNSLTDVLHFELALEELPSYL